MHAQLQSKLRLPPKELFAGGACHVYARALKRHFPTMQLRRAGNPDSFTETPKGMHVYCRRGGLLVDASQIAREADYLHLCNYQAWDCTEDELFAPYHQTERGPLNRWRHNLDPEFIARADSIAEQHIASRRASIWDSLQRVETEQT
jgi:hypothetical protein